jgi:hypothetical protein
MPIVVRRIPDRMAALGAAARYLAGRQPFASFTAGSFIGTLAGQVGRGHCLFALDGLAVRGYLGWALLDTAEAERFARTGAPPPDAACRGRDVVWLLTAATDSALALKALLAAGRAEYPGLRVMGTRHKPGGRRVVFSQHIPRRSSA